jgi:ATP-binding cassette subfamily C protein
LVAALPALNQARQAWATLTVLFERTDGQDATRTNLPAPTGNLTLANVHVRGGVEGPWLLNNISFSASSGEVIGVIGSSGAGKTTLARVLSGGLIPDAGVLRLDSANILDWEPESLACHIGYMPQDSAMLPGTIAENISRFAVYAGEDRASVDEKLVVAARKAGAHEMILGLAGGYDRVIDMDGNGLSAGQRQRISLARALYGDPAILVLDEPNSAQDAEGEAALGRAISEARQRGALIILVAHRSGILMLVDQLLVLTDGRVSQFGPRAEVMAVLNANIPAKLVGKGGLKP